MTIRAAFYVRVSLADTKPGKAGKAIKRMHVENQLPDLHRLAEIRRYETVHVFEEKMSGAKKSRPALDAMMAAARRGDFDIVCVWALDRLGRSQMNMLELIRDLEHYGVGIVSCQEAWMDTTGPTRQLLISIMTWVAEQERTRIIERTRAGVARARSEGKVLGRPRLAVDLDAALRLRKAGLSIADAAGKMGVSKATLQRALCSPDVPASARARVLPAATDRVSV